MAKGVGNAPTSGLSRSCFQDRCSQLVSACLPEMVRVAGLALWWPRASTLLLPRWWPRANARLLLTLHPEIGCQTWTRTKTNGLTDRCATLTPPGNDAAGRSSTCIVPLRRRMPHVFGHSSNLKLVSAAGFAPAVTRSQAGHVAATPRAVRPGVLGAHRGLCFMGMAGPTHLEPVSRGKNRKLADPKGVAPSAFPQTTGCSAN